MCMCVGVSSFWEMGTNSILFLTNRYKDGIAKTRSLLAHSVGADIEEVRQTFFVDIKSLIKMHNLLLQIRLADKSVGRQLLLLNFMAN